MLQLHNRTFLKKFILNNALNKRTSFARDSFLNCLLWKAISVSCLNWLKAFCSQWFTEFVIMTFTVILNLRPSLLCAIQAKVVLWTTRFTVQKILPLFLSSFPIIWFLISYFLWPILTPRKQNYFQPRSLDTLNDF